MNWSLITYAWEPSPGPICSVPSYGSPFSSVMDADGTARIGVLISTESSRPTMCSTVGDTRRPRRSSWMRLIESLIAVSLEASMPSAASTATRTSSSISW